ncbi:MAG: electron transfer flavoprotein subunit beta/FixA family protein [Fusobacterium sp. JB021]|nr:electron transfer flavoprotein subunit beta/FixA family protein [Fusobacterium sp. JB020]MDP0492754.1 electron transfer flavoprotein subunit beta/FixA family protein [Fusobacterium sp. JB021]MDP0507079.1 electron transfer flavoprotein subunit beta/FixA family protein [Fusobacterium sp. JB019]
MNILVCIKQVPDDSVEVSVKDNRPALEDIGKVVNAFDTYALEMATRFKEANDGEITVLSIGDKSTEKSLKNCLAVGGNKAVLINDKEFKESDALGTAYILASGIRKLEEENGKEFDIIFCGKESTDTGCGQVGAQISEILGRGFVTDIIEVSNKEDIFSFNQETEEGYNVVETSCPCVVTVTKPNYDPRYPTIKNKMKARRMPIDDLEISNVEKVVEKGAYVKIINFYEPPKKEAGIKIQEEKCEDSTLKAIQIMSEAKVF